MFRSVLFFVVLCVYSTFAFSQAEIRGTLIDSVHNSVVGSATVSVYKEGEETVEKVVLTDLYGRFVIEGAVALTPLRLHFSHMGFQSVDKELVLERGEKRDLGKINIFRDTLGLEAVDIRPPVSMRGDTIEFNADAFQLDTNAVIEDLLYKLPGIVIWGDGKITYQGREIPTVLVNGKPFFGKDKAIALRNIEKNAVEKVQLYGRNSKQQPLYDDDGKYEMNVVLKEGKEKMYFGNLTIGRGTDKREESFLTMNYADRHIQSTLAYARNNTNKRMHSTDQLLSNTTFKSAGIHGDLNPDFIIPGETKQQVLGGRFQYDFLGEKHKDKENLFIADLFYNNSKTLLVDSSHTEHLTQSTGEKNLRNHQQISDNNYKTGRANLEHKYKTRRNRRIFQLENRVDFDQVLTDASTESSTGYDYVHNQSSNSIVSLGSNDHKNLKWESSMYISSALDPGMNIKFAKGTKNPYSLIERMGIGIHLSADLSDKTNSAHKKAKYVNFLDNTLDHTQDRSYEETFHRQSYEAGISLQLERWEMSHEFTYNRHSSDHLVQDFDEQENKLETNAGLSYLSHFHRWSYTPALKYANSIYGRQLPGRMESSLFLRTQLATRIHKEQNRSSLLYRNVKQYFVTPLPQVTIHQNYSRLGRFAQTSKLSYSYDEEYPQLDQLHPVYDDLYPTYRFFGSPSLTRVKKHFWETSFGYRQLRSNGYKSDIKLSYSRVKNGIVDSIVNAENQQQHFLTQAQESMPEFSITIDGAKATQLKKDQTLGIDLRTVFSFGKRPQYFDGAQQLMYTQRKSVDVKLHHTYKDRITTSWLNYWSGYKRVDRLSSLNAYTSSFLSTGLNINYFVNKKLTVESKALGRFTSSTFNSDRSLIWNAGMTYSFMKGKNIQVKLSVHDILGQNKGIYFYDSPIEFTTGYRNNLTQYYMLSLSYFPRKFGL